MKQIKTREELIKFYVDFFKGKKHKEIANAPLIPENDSTVLFTTAGMHPLVPYLSGQKHPLGNRLCGVQKCIRTTDIDDVGDESHFTFFEMLGNWSLGDYFKQEAIEYSFEFLTKVLGISKEKLTISCFKGDKDAPKDTEASGIWESLGIKKKQIRFLGKEDNWWGPAGETGPCGPDTEMFFNGLEIWNDVFMQYTKNEKGNFEESKQKNVDTGMGVERTLAILQGKKSAYETHTFLPLIEKIEKLSKRKYGKNNEDTRAMRIIADHIKASVMIMAEGIEPSNKEQGYIVRRLIRRAVRFGKTIMIQNNFTKDLAEIVLGIYKDYKHLQKNKKFIFEQIEKEEIVFRGVLASGLRYFNRVKNETKGKIISGRDAFLLYQSYGFPLEMAQELAKENKLKIDMIGFEKEQAKHKKLSRKVISGRFKSGLADKGGATTKLHTATHLLLSALRQVLGEHVEQKGSNITSDRLRFDFSHEEKLTDKQLQETEDIVNKNIKAGLDIKREEMTVQEAKKAGATGVFEDRYKNKVSIYTICSSKGDISKEICAGPHVTNTKKLGKLKIKKQESVGKGIRRLKAVLE